MNDVTGSPAYSLRCTSADTGTSIEYVAKGDCFKLGKHFNLDGLKKKCISPVTNAAKTST